MTTDAVTADGRADAPEGGPNAEHRTDYKRLPHTSAAANSERAVVSMVIATYDRLSHLQRCIARVRANVSIAHEIIVVAGETGDGTWDWLAAQSDLTVIREPERQGAARAFDRGFRSAVGTYVMWLNDDSYPLPGAVEAAVRMIERPDLTDLGLVAFYHNFDRSWNRLDTVEHQGEAYSVYNVRGTPYANFGLLRRSLLERLGFLDLRYYFAAWDPDLSLKVQRQAGLKVIGCPEALIFHDELIDERKSADRSALAQDNARLFDKWNLPSKFGYPDPAPAYQAMLRERGIVGAEAPNPTG
ncbi:MAG: glycosyltransferase family 2 protein [Planctomycetes bacterium]|nr:glycosyltransferase family 2 protein [Planctomycetota bacterium]